MKHTTLGYIEYEGKYLMLFRYFDKKDGSLGKWLGTGGKLEAGETADECFIREAFEETGIRLTPEKLVREGIVDFTSCAYESERMFLYTAKAESGYFNPDCSEGTLKWIDKHSILSLPLWEGDHIFLKKILDGHHFFALTLTYGGKNGDRLESVTEDRLLLTDYDATGDEAAGFFNKYTENQLRHIYEPKPGVFIAETPMVIERALKAGYEPLCLLCQHERLFDAAAYNCPDIKLLSGSEEGLRLLTGYNLTMGMLCVMRRKPLPPVAELLSNPAIKKIAVLENINNPTNTGALVRSAAALGADALILTAAGSDPLYRRAIRVSLGNIFLVPYTVCRDNSYIDTLKANGFLIISLALSDTAVGLKDPVLKDLREKKVALCLGTESTGISDHLLSVSDYVVKIPMSRGVDSLNVAAAGAVAFWEFWG